MRHFKWLCALILLSLFAINLTPALANCIVVPIGKPYAVGGPVLVSSKIVNEKIQYCRNFGPQSYCVWKITWLDTYATKQKQRARNYCCCETTGKCAWEGPVYVIDAPDKIKTKKRITYEIRPRF